MYMCIYIYTTFEKFGVGKFYFLCYSEILLQFKIVFYFNIFYNVIVQVFCIL